MSSSQIVKFGQRGSVSPVNDVDVGIYQLQQSEKLLEDQVKKLGLEADRYATLAPVTADEILKKIFFFFFSRITLRSV